MGLQGDLVGESSGGPRGWVFRVESSWVYNTRLRTQSLPNDLAVFITLFCIPLNRKSHLLNFCSDCYIRLPYLADVPRCICFPHAFC